MVKNIKVKSSSNAKLTVCILLLKITANFMPTTKIYKTKNEINSFLSEFALRGSSVDFVSNRAS